MPPRRQAPSRSARASTDPRDDAAVALADRLHSAAIHLLRRLRTEDDASGLTAPRLSALSVIIFRGPLTLGELAAAEQVKPPTISRLVQELEREGLVRRVGDSGDRRIQRVIATAAGSRLLREGRRRRVAALAASLRALGPADRRSLENAVAILQRVVREPERPEGAGRVG
ncbi:MAG TPA: MarR family transcriptional regulator [Gemmatimonadaceae bacterium]|nr:MarR family transcriptional regulator [Gemmatimonadaceae bacterium]